MKHQQILKLIKDKIKKTKNKRDKEKLIEIEKAVKEGKMQKAKKFVKERD
jgi:hypothetical protein